MSSIIVARLVIVLLLAASLVTSTNAAALGFASQKICPTPGAHALVMADFNGDGKRDVAVINDTGVSVLLGTGTGGFQPAVNLATGTKPVAIAVGDFTGDGKLDIATANAGDSASGIAPSISGLVGNGDGTFQAMRNHGLSLLPLAIAAADFSGDGRSDVVVVNRATTAIFPSNGDGTLRSEVDYATGGNAVALADFNHDGNVDIALGWGSPTANMNETYYGRVTILLGNGGGTFRTGSSFYPGAVGTMAVGDFNNDGKPDLVVTYHTNIFSTYAYWVWLGAGDGTFTSSARGPQASDIAVSVADVNNDGRPDLVTGSTRSQSPSGAYINVASVHVYLNNGFGGFQPAQIFTNPTIVYGSGSAPIPVAIGDLNGDALRDFLFPSGGGIGVMLNRSAGTAADMSASMSFGGIVTSPTLTIIANNRGPQTATSVKVSDTLPSVLHFVSATASQGSCSGTSLVTCNFGTLAPGTIAWVKINVSAPSTGYSFTNSAIVSSAVTDPDATNNTATISFSYKP